MVATSMAGTCLEKNEILVGIRKKALTSLFLGERAVNRLPDKFEAMFKNSFQAPNTNDSVFLLNSDSLYECCTGSGLVYKNIPRVGQFQLFQLWALFFSTLREKSSIKLEQRVSAMRGIWGHLPKQACPVQVPTRCNGLAVCPCSFSLDFPGHCHSSGIGC